MTGELVLVTGASGHLGFRAVVNSLEHGYDVRAAVRSQAKVDVVLAAPSIKALAPGSKLQFVIVPDILADGAYDEAVQGVTYVLHIASPLPNPSDDYERDMILPAVGGTTGIFKSAAKTSTVKRIVITSSIVAIAAFEHCFDECGTVFTADERIPDYHGPFVHPFQAYSASKAAALNAAENFMKDEKPSFDFVPIMPSFFIGKNELLTNAEEYMASGTSRVALAPALGHKADSANPGAMIHVDDVALVHVLALNPKIKAQSFGMMSGGVAGNKWDDALDIVKKHFPEAVKDGRLPANGTQPSKEWLIDTSRTEKVLGIKFRSYETQVVSVVEHYLELLKKAGK